MFPDSAGQTLFLDSYYQDQNSNWSGSAKAPAADNPDKDIRTDFVTAGLQDMFDRSWGLQIEMPYDSRHFVTTGGATGQEIVTSNWSGPGDLRVQGIYTGFSADLSTGVTFGLKLPTGDSTHNDAFGDVDRDSEIGTGSTDVLLGGFHRGILMGDGSWTWFSQVVLDLPVLARDQYRPGAEADAAIGIYYRGWMLGGLKITPVAQAKVSDRSRDTGANAADPVASGFQRLLLAPGVELDWGRLMAYADIELAAYQHFTGNQLAAPVLTKVSLSYMF